MKSEKAPTKNPTPTLGSSSARNGAQPLVWVPAPTPAQLAPVHHLPPTTQVVVVSIPGAVANPILQAAASSVQSATLPGQRVSQCQINPHPSFLLLWPQIDVLPANLATLSLPDPADREVVSHLVRLFESVQPDSQVLCATAFGRHVPLAQLDKASHGD